jgi:hypothetical protein
MPWENIEVLKKEREIKMIVFLLIVYFLWLQQTMISLTCSPQAA